MGFNTVVLILNDRLSEIEHDEKFGRNVALAVQRSHHNGPIDTTGQTMVMPTYHADEMRLYFAHGNNITQMDGFNSRVEELHARGFGGSLRADIEHARWLLATMEKKLDKLVAEQES